MVAARTDIASRPRTGLLLFCAVPTSGASVVGQAGRSLYGFRNLPRTSSHRLGHVAPCQRIVWDTHNLKPGYDEPNHH